jgi:thioredoxin reductase
VTRVDVLVVGGGPAGLSAATALRRVGLTVTVADREPELGGIPRHSEHLGYGMRDVHRVLPGPKYARLLVQRAAAAGADLRPDTTVLQIDGRRATCATPAGPTTFEARAVVIATGVRERPRAARLVPGDRPAGVVTTGALQQFSAFHHQTVGRRAVVVGAEHVSFSAILTLRHTGCEAVAMVTEHERHQTYLPLRLLTATRHRVPIITGASVTSIVGRRRVEAVELSDGTAIECDTVVFTGDWIADHELARRTGVECLPAAGAATTDACGRTAVEGVWAAGNLAHPAETADICALGGRAVTGSTVDYLDRGVWPERVTPIAVDPPIAWASWSAQGLTMRVTEFVTARIELDTAAGRIVSRRRRLIPNRSITIDVPGRVDVVAARLV